ncbi:MAG: hypothetical protein ACPLPT_04075 [Moorellales bacterium]
MGRPADRAGFPGFLLDGSGVSLMRFRKEQLPQDLLEEIEVLQRRVAQLEQEVTDLKAKQKHRDGRADRQAGATADSRDGCILPRCGSRFLCAA